MKPITVVKGRMVPFFRPDVDTDQIISKQFLKRIERTGYGPFLFYNWAHLDNGEPDPSFVLNRDDYRGANVLLAGPNFGCGSSREHAVWALQDFGFEAIVAPSFADIFYNNSSKVGLVCVTLNEDAVLDLVTKAEGDHLSEIVIDLRSSTVTCGDFRREFEIDPFVRDRLINGWDDIALTEQFMDEIAKFESRRSELFPVIRHTTAELPLLTLRAARQKDE